eukprot:131896_1
MTLVVLLIIYAFTECNGWDGYSEQKDGEIYQNKAQMKKNHQRHKIKRSANDERPSHGHYNYVNDIFSGTMYDGDNFEGTEESEYSADKEQLIAFLLSLFLGCVGGGRWYVGDYGIAIGKLLFLIIFCCIPWFVNKILCDGPNYGTGFLLTLCLMAVFGLVICGWWMADVIMFGLNQITDQNGLILQPW